MLIANAGNPLPQALIYSHGKWMTCYAKMCQGFSNFCLQRKEAEYQQKKRETAATKIQRFYRGFRYVVWLETKLFLLSKALKF